MRRLHLLLLFLLALTLTALGSVATRDAQTPRPPHFAYVDLYLDTAGRPLAAYQIELIIPHHAATIVGVESGSAKGFIDPPYYDPAALAGGRIIIGSYLTDAAAPTGKIHLARIDLEETADPTFETKLQVALSPDQKNIPATVTAVPGAAP